MQPAPAKVPSTRRDPIRGILFDKDGTLLDFCATWLPAYRRSAEQIAAFADRTDAQSLLAAVGYDTATGRCDPHSVLAAGTNLELATAWAAICGLDVELVLPAVERTLDEFARRDAMPITDLDTFFAGLTARGFVLGVATMDSEATARAMLDRFGVLGHLSFLCGGDSGCGTKPGPGMVDAFLAATGLRAGEVVVVGDTPHDMEMARAAGAACRVGVLSGAGTREALEPIADYVIASITNLDDVLRPPLPLRAPAADARACARSVR